MARLNENEIQEGLATVSGAWRQEGEAIVRIYRFADFVESVGFVDRLVAPAEEMAHHPDVAISWNEVTVTVTTHSAGGLTAADFELAAKIDALV
ncbi:MAG: 4a-hydroxytetrahydrobiopterin dehydratase [Solirubrobacterales bacterium]